MQKLIINLQDLLKFAIVILNLIISMRALFQIKEILN